MKWGKMLANQNMSAQGRRALCKTRCRPGTYRWPPPQAGKLASLSRLCANITHEIGNPLIGVTYLLDDLASRAGLDPADRELIESGLQDCRRMRDYLTSLGNSCQVPAGIPVVLDLNLLVEEVLHGCSETFGGAEITVRSELDPDVGGVRGAEIQLRELITSLVKNGVEAMAPGGGTLLVLTSRRPDGTVLEISDSGTGIAPDWQEYIFDPLFSTKEESTNRGLGLTVAACIVQACGGTIGFSTEPGCGSTFIVTIPDTA